MRRNQRQDRKTGEEDRTQTLIVLHEGLMLVGAGATRRFDVGWLLRDLQGALSLDTMRHIVISTHMFPVVCQRELHVAAFGLTPSIGLSTPYDPKVRGKSFCVATTRSGVVESGEWRTKEGEGCGPPYGCTRHDRFGFSTKKKPNTTHAYVSALEGKNRRLRISIDRKVDELVSHICYLSQHITETTCTPPSRPMPTGFMGDARRAGQRFSPPLDPLAHGAPNVTIYDPEYSNDHEDDLEDDTLDGDAIDLGGDGDDGAESFTYDTFGFHDERL